MGLRDKTAPIVDVDSFVEFVRQLTLSRVEDEIDHDKFTDAMEGARLIHVHLCDARANQLNLVDNQAQGGMGELTELFANLAKQEAETRALPHNPFEEEINSMRETIDAEPADLSDLADIVLEAS